MECGEASMVIAISESGRMARPMGTECMSGKMGTSTRANGMGDSNMGMVQISSPMGISIKDNILVESLMALDSTSGGMETFTWGNLKTD